MRRWPTLEQAGVFAAKVGVRNQKQWERYLAGMSRAGLFKRVVEVLRTECAEK